MTGGRRSVTRKDVAQLAGVSETIVSYVLNNNRYVSAEKRGRVLEAVERLHYRPNSIARALKGKGSSYILFIADNIENEYFGRLVHEMDSFAYDKGYVVSLLSVRNNADFVSRILARQVDAVIISSSSFEERYILELLEAGLPVVLLMTRDYPNIDGRAARIYTGIESGIMVGVRYLYEHGCRHLVHVDRVSERGHFSDRQDLRYRGFCNQMEAFGLALTPGSFLTGLATHEALYEAVCRRIHSGEAVDGFVCRNDQLACTVLSAVQACGKAVPGEISVIGFDNASVSTIIRPALTTLELNRTEIAKATIGQIENMIHGQEAQACHFTTRLLVRDTTR
ncbi:MAG: LacI family DNA-binding transcriptional regulator [Candidatus Limiplasma sp.]|nr:LacI family DNA-binding transcriptional regulator [Candidatus Limiplasma sp.]